MSRRSAPRLLIVLAMALVTSAGLPPQAPAASPTETLGVYRGPGAPNRVAEWEGWLGRQVPYALDNTGTQPTWSEIKGTLGWVARAWKGSRYRMVTGIAMLPNSGATLAQGSTGAYNAHWTEMAQTLVANGHADARLRLGWEFNGNWYPWKVDSASAASSYAAYWRQIVTAMRAVPGANFKFDWNPALGGSWFGGVLLDPAKAYPGDAYVDAIGLDAYDHDWYDGYEDHARRWESLMNQAYGLRWHRDFAATHGKPMSFPEWGLERRSDGHGGGDNPLYIQRMHDWIAANDVAYQLYFEWDVTVDERHELMGPYFPNAAAKFKELFGPSAGSTPPPSSPPPADSPSPPPADPAPPPAADSTAPSVDLTAPLEGSKFDRTLNMSANAADVSGVARVDFFFDSVKVGSDDAAPYSLSYRVPKKASFGRHTVTAKAYDAAGNLAQDTVSVTRSRTLDASASRKLTACRARRAAGARTQRASARKCGLARRRSAVRPSA